jgi:hypothetical protein
MSPEGNAGIPAEGASMFKLSALTAAAGSELVRTIDWSAGTRQNVVLSVTLRYVSPETLKEEQSQKQRQVMQERRLSPVEDVAQIQDATERAFYSLLADRVVKVEGLTYRGLSHLLAVSPDQIAKAGGFDAPVPLDTTSTDPLTAEEQTGYGAGVKTKGDAARQDIRYLLQTHYGFRTFVAQTVIDVSCFQDSEWEKAAKN